MNDATKHPVPVHAEDDYVVSLRDLYQILRRRAWIIVLTSILMAGVALGLSLSQPPLYEASIKILIGQGEGFIGPTGDPTLLQSLSVTLAEAINTEPIAEDVIQRLDLRTNPEALLAGLSAEPLEGTQFIDVSYTHSDPEKARLIANAFGAVFVERVSELTPNSATLRATVWQRAEAPELVDTNTQRNALLALILGGMLGVGLAFLLEFLHGGWRSPEEAEQSTGVPILGVLPAAAKANGHKSNGKMNGALGEEYRVLRTNLVYALAGEGLKVILVNSPGPKEGKTTVCANLGSVLAQAGKTTLVMDCDLRKPALHKIFGLQNISGVSDVLVGEYGFRDVCQEHLPGLWVMTAGPVPPNPAELLGSEQFAALIEEARREFDYVLVDSAPTRLVSDAAILAAQVDGVLLVVHFHHVDIGSVHRSIRSLEAGGGDVLGMVMNNVKGLGTGERAAYKHYNTYLGGGTNVRQVDQ
jgi:receptor protein-tyrosine kinase